MSTGLLGMVTTVDPTRFYRHAVDHTPTMNNKDEHVKTSYVPHKVQTVLHTAHTAISAGSAPLAFSASCIDDQYRRYIF